ncbi:MAG TPA: hypothetical protein VKS21_02345 [Spirochaetota bacterium]|nr:hypothetical protein [Spirochaetota bacterium]
MNFLILEPEIDNFVFSFYCKRRKIFYHKKADMCRGLNTTQQEWQSCLKEIIDSFDINSYNAADTIVVIRVICGGTVFTAPEIVNCNTITKLEQLIPHAPLHMPGTIELVKACNNFFSSIPVLLVFGDTFFKSLPERERVYALNRTTADKIPRERYGLNGLVHQAACFYLWRILRQRFCNCQPGVISIHLGDFPEVVALKGSRAVMLSYPLPGETFSPETDPGIILTLAQEFNWGPEKLNKILTQKCGWYGLTGSKTDLSRIFKTDDNINALAQQVCRYQLLQSCAAGAAVAGRIDALVFSGRFCKAGNYLRYSLKQDLETALAGAKKDIYVDIYDQSYTAAVRDIADNYFVNY